MNIPFDNNTGEKYSLTIHPKDQEEGDGVQLVLNRAACKSFAELFNNLSEQEGEFHIHLGYTEEEPQGPGFRIQLK